MADPILKTLKESRRRNSRVTAVLLVLVAVALLIVGYRFDPAATLIEGRHLEALILATALIFSAFVLGYFYVQRQWLAAHSSVRELLSDAIAESAQQRQVMAAGAGKPDPDQPASRELQKL
jgi:uncharacterized membrane protein (DUF485 family)